MPSRRLPSVEEAYKLFKADPYKRLNDWAEEWGCSHERVRQLREQAGFAKVSEIDYNLTRKIVERIRSGEYTLTQRNTYEDLPIGYEKFVNWYEEDPSVYLAVLEAQQWAYNEKMNPTEKECSGCNRTIQIGNFKRNQNYVDGYSKVCSTYPTCCVTGDPILSGEAQKIKERIERIKKLKNKE